MRLLFNDMFKLIRSTLCFITFATNFMDVPSKLPSIG